MQRLQYAFKAALKSGKTFEAVKLALLAGEKIAGNSRQLDILKNNIDLASTFLAPARLQELAHRKEISGNWDGSETAYSASLLSTISSLKGEAHSYLRSANHWLNRYFEKRDDAKNDEERFMEKLENLEILELAHTIYRIRGNKQCVNFLLSWTPSSCIFKATSALIERLIDIGDYKNIELMANYGKGEPSFILAVASELIKIGRTPPKSCLTRCLNKIIKPKSKLDRPGDDIHDVGFSNDAYLSFFEACVIHKLPSVNIRRGLNYYYEAPRLYRIADEHQWKGARENFLRFLSLQAAISKNFSLDFEKFTPKEWQSKKNGYEENRELERAKEYIRKLLPWYMVRAKVFSGITLSLKKEHENAYSLASKVGSRSYQGYEPIPFETTKAKFQNILICSSDYLDELELFSNNYNEQKLKVSFVDDLYFLRAACRADKLKELSGAIENNCYSSLKSHDYEDPPESRSENLLTLCRAVLSEGIGNAEAYFDDALNKASDFGEEGVIRWEALTSIAKRSAQEGKGSAELAHGYMRCAEMIGDSVAREKYWDRNDAVATCFQLSPESAFPILHRWKDREVGWHERLIKPLVNSAIDFSEVPSSTIWSLSAFAWENGLDDFLEKCLSNQPTKALQQQMMEHYIHDLRIQGVTGDIWLTVQGLANRFELNCLSEELIKELSKSSIPERESEPTTTKSTENKDKFPWEETFGSFDLLTESGFNKAYQNLLSQGYPRRTEEFWHGCLKKITQRNVITFLNLIVHSESLGFYDLSGAFEQIPENWKYSASVKKH